MKGRVLLTGATGAVGPSVAQLLCSSGWRVMALVRSRPPAGLIDGAELIIGDLTQPSSFADAAKDVDAIVHMAALLHITGQRLNTTDYVTLNVHATQALVKAAGSRPFVFFSTINVYGVGGPFTEDSRVSPRDAYATSKVEAESVVLNAGGTVLRLAAVYGSRAKGNYASLVRALSRGVFVPIGEGSNHRTLVHEADVARATGLALEARSAAGQIYNVTNGTTHSVREIIEAISSALGRRPPRFSLPVPIARILGSAVPPIGLRVAKYLEDIRVDASKLRRELAFQPIYDLPGGWAEALRSR